VPLRPGVKRADDSESYLGDAHGRWDGDTLVVETTNFNELTWLPTMALSIRRSSRSPSG
jgi:hypothetical protein